LGAAVPRRHVPVFEGLFSTTVARHDSDVGNQGGLDRLTQVAEPLCPAATKHLGAPLLHTVRGGG